MGFFYMDLNEELPMDLETPIFASWFNFRTGEHRARVIQNSTELWVLNRFAEKGHLEIYTYTELKSGGNEQ